VEEFEFVLAEASVVVLIEHGKDLMECLLFVVMLRSVAVVVIVVVVRVGVGAVAGVVGLMVAKPPPGEGCRIIGALVLGLSGAQDRHEHGQCEDQREQCQRKPAMERHQQRVRLRLRLRLREEGVVGVAGRNENNE
jgi:hypothetical protein